MQNQLKMLKMLGFKFSKWVTNESGISIYVPENVYSNEWCINLPNGINHDDKNGFCYYDVSFSFIKNILSNELPKEKVDEMDNYMLNKIENNCKKDQNCVAVYKNKRNISFYELGRIIGVTKQRAEQICKSKIRDETIRRFAEYEGISISEFKEIYCE